MLCKDIGVVEHSTGNILSEQWLKIVIDDIGRDNLEKLISIAIQKCRERRGSVSGQECKQGTLVLRYAL